MFKWLAKALMLDVESPWKRLLCSLVIVVVLLGTFTGCIIAIIFSLGAVKESGKKAGFEGPFGIKIEIAKLEKKLDALAAKEALREKKLDSLVADATRTPWSYPLIAPGNLFGDYDLATVRKYFSANEEVKKGYFAWAKEQKLPTGFKSPQQLRDQFPKDFWDQLPKDFKGQFPRDSGGGFRK
jgi:hypothetical protein